MPYIVITSVYPSDKTKEVVEKYIEVMGKYPPDENLETAVVPVAATRNEKGIKSMTIAEVKPGKLEEAYVRGANAMAMFNDVQGFECTIDVYMTREEGLATIGITMPG